MYVLASSVTDYAALGGFIVLIIAAIGGQLVSIIQAWRTPAKVIAANVAAAAKVESAANKVVAVQAQSARQAHTDQSITHDKLDKQGETLEAVHEISNSAKTALEALLAKTTNERDNALRELGREPPPQEAR